MSKLGVFSLWNMTLNYVNFNQKGDKIMKLQYNLPYPRIYHAGGL